MPSWLLPSGQMFSSAWPVWQHSFAVTGSSAAPVPSPLVDLTYCREVPAIESLNIHLNFTPQQVSYHVPLYCIARWFSN